MNTVNTNLLQSDTKLKVIFQWSTFKKLVSIEPEQGKLYYNEFVDMFSLNELEDSFFGEFDFITNLNFQKVVETWEENPKKEIQTVEGTWITTIGENGTCILQIVVNDKQVPLIINGKSYMFKCVNKKSNEEDNSLTITMELADSSERIITNQEEYDEQFKKMEKEVDEYNNNVREAAEYEHVLKRQKDSEEREKKKQDLQKQYKSLSQFRKFFGGKKLKKKHDIS